MSGARRLLVWGARLAAVGCTWAAATGTAAAADDCWRRLAAIDAGGRVVFETIAVPTGVPGVAAAPLHPLERGGVRWSRLEILPANGNAGSPIVAANPRPGLNLALLRVDAAAACDSGSRTGAGAPVSGSAVRLERERLGFRSAVIGGRVERVVDLGDRGRIALVHLLDDGGSDPGLTLDEGGALLGATMPAPAGADPSLAAVLLAPAGLEDTGDGWAPPRVAIAARPAPAAFATPAGMVAAALLLGGRDHGTRGIALLSAAIDQGADLAPVRLERGALEFGAGLLPAATADFERAASIDGTSHLARFNLGVTLGAAGRYSEAAEAFAGARDLAPNHARTRYQLALSLKLLHRDAEARREADALGAIDPALAQDLLAIIGR